MVAKMNIFTSLFFLLILISEYTALLADSSITSVDFETRIEIPTLVEDPPVDGGPEDAQGAASEVVAVAEPNIAALLGIGTLAANPGLLEGIQKHGLLSGGGRSPTPQSTPDFSSLCSSNSDALTNLLVYQYLSGSIPAGVDGVTDKPNGAAPKEAVTSLNPQLLALRNVEVSGKTSTSISTTITTRIITMDASTNYFTSKTSYVTTVTQVTSSVLPIIFRGSKLITTITDKITEVVTATEFKTSSAVFVPSVIQTLPVEITFHHRSTIGSNGQYSLDRISTGATKVLDKPISTSKVNFDNNVLNLSSLDLSSLTSLIDQYSDQDAERGRNRGRFNPRRNEKSHQDRRARFRDRRRDRQPAVEEEPKFHVLSGFTYSDRPAKSNRKSLTGTASLNTRYSKFRKKNPLKNNNVSPLELDRESEPYSATTSRRTFSSPHKKRPSSHSSSRTRFHDTFKTGGDLDRQASSISGVRRHREIDNPMRRTGRTIRKEKQIYQNSNYITREKKHKDHLVAKTTVLTMYMTGPKPGQTVSLERTITLRNLSPTRLKRYAVPIQPTKVLMKMETPSRIRDPSYISQDDVLTLLKGLDKKRVNEMLRALHKWVDYYIENIGDQTEESNLLSTNHIELEEDPAIELSPSHDKAKFISEQDATVTLPILPRAITAQASLNSDKFQQCQSPVTHTKTVFKTVYLNA